MQHVGCTAYAHEAAALLGGDDLAVKAAALRTDFTAPRDVVVTYLPDLAPGAAPLRRIRAAGVAVVRSRQIRTGYSRATCEVAARTAERVGLGPDTAPRPDRDLRVVERQGRAAAASRRSDRAGRPLRPGRRRRRAAAPPRRRAGGRR